MNIRSHLGQGHPGDLLEQVLGEPAQAGRRAARHDLSPTLAETAAINKSFAVKAVLFELELLVPGTVKITEYGIHATKAERSCHFFENLLNIRPVEDILLGIGISKLAVGVFTETAAHAVVCLPLFCVRQHRIGLVDLLHHLCTGRIFFVAVRMIFKCQFPVGRLYFLSIRFAIHPQDLIVILLCHAPLFPSFELM